MYQYFTPVYSKEHMLFGKEIAERYGIMTVNDQPHTRLVKLLIAQQLEDFPESLQLPIYYLTKTGPVRVYCFAIYDKVCKSFIQRSKLVDGEMKTIRMFDGNKTVNFKYKIKE